MARTYIPQRLDGNVWEVVTGEGEWKHGPSFPRLRDARRYARRQGAIEPIEVVDGGKDSRATTGL